MKGIKRRMVALSVLSTLASSAWSLPVFFNEIHYDNSSRDYNEAIEVAGLAGTDLSGWQLLLYNGNSGGVYSTEDLSGVIADQQNGYGVLSFELGGIQNGSPDGFALVDGGGDVMQFLSYEGVFEATAGAALGMTSTDIGVSEDGATTDDFSLQLGGSGQDWMDFSWSADLASFGDVNEGQFFPAQQSSDPVAAVPEPGSLPLFAMGAVLLACRRLQNNRKM